MILNHKVTTSPSSMGVVANYFKVIDISVPTSVIFRGENFHFTTLIKAGLSIDFTVYGEPLREIIFEGGTEQNVQFWAGVAKAGDTSLSGTIGVGAGKRITYNPKQTVTSAATVEIFPLDTQRKIGTFSTDGVVYVEDASNGIRLEAGLHVWENGQPLKLIAETTDVEVRSQDEGY